MKFLLITLEYFPFKGGVANYYTNLVHHWPQLGGVTVLDNQNNQLVKKRGVLRWWPAIKVVFKKVKKGKIDNILVGQILPLGTVAFILSFFTKTKYSLFFHGMDLSFCLKNPWKKFLSQLIIKRADKIICANSFVRELLFDAYSLNQERVEVVNPGINNFDFKNQDLKNKLISQYNLKGKRVLFTLGRLVRRKGVDRTILALQKILEPHPNLRDSLKYFIAGDGPDKEYLESLAEKTFGENFSQHIVFLGKITEEEKWTFLSLSDIFIMPARNIAGDFEGFGIVFLEAALLSKPVIAGKSGGISDAVTDQVSGLMVDPESEEDIATAILKLLNDNDLAQKLGEQGRKRAIEDFSWKRQVDKIYNFLK